MQKSKTLCTQSFMPLLSADNYLNACKSNSIKIIDKYYIQSFKEKDEKRINGLTKIFNLI